MGSVCSREEQESSKMASPATNIADVTTKLAAGYVSHTLADATASIGAASTADHDMTRDEYAAADSSADNDQSHASDSPANSDCGSAPESLAKSDNVSEHFGDTDAEPDEVSEHFGDTDSEYGKRCKLCNESVPGSIDDDATVDDGPPALSLDKIKESLKTRLDNVSQQSRFHSFFKINPKLAGLNPGLEIEGLRRFGMPLSKHDVQAMIAESHKSPYGKGAETVVDEAVRKTWEIDASRIKLMHPDWPAALQTVLIKVCGDLGIPGGVRDVEAQLYKLLIYEEGAMFKPHKDSEKAARMFGTLVICLPSQHSGGDVSISFNGETHQLSTAETSEWSTICLAWYSDVVHEIQPVTAGYRVVLTFNLIAKEGRQPPGFGSLETYVADIRAVLQQWQVNKGPEFFVHVLEHQYTRAAIRADSLKGRDHDRVRCMMQLQSEFDLTLCFANLEAGEEGDCDDIYEECSHGEHRDICHIRDRSLELIRVRDLEGRHLLDNVPVNLKKHLLGGFDVFGGLPAREEFSGYGNEAYASSRHIYQNMALIIIPRGKWPAFRIQPTLAYYGLRKLRDLLEADFTKLSEDPGNLGLQDQCEQLCIAAIDTGPYSATARYNAVVDVCLEHDQKNCAAKAMCRYVEQLSETAEDDAALNLGLVEDCLRIGRSDLLDLCLPHVVTPDRDVFFKAYTICVEMDRDDLALLALDNFRRPMGDEYAGSLLATLQLLARQSQQRSFDDLRLSFDICFANIRDHAECRNLLDKMFESAAYSTLSDDEKSVLANFDYLEKYLAELEKLEYIGSEFAELEGALMKQE